MTERETTIEAEAEITIESLVGNRTPALIFDQNNILHLLLDRASVLDRTYLCPLKNAFIVEAVLRASIRAGSLNLTATSGLNPLVIEKWHNKPDLERDPNLEAAKIARKVAGEKGFVGGVISPTIGIEYMWDLQDQFVRSVVRQAESLRSGGVSYYLYKFSNIWLFRRIIDGIAFSDKRQGNKPLPIIFTFPIKESSKIPQLVKVVQETNRVLAAGITLDFDELQESLWEIRELKAKLGNTPLVVMLYGRYKYSGTKIVPVLKADHIYWIIQELAKRGVSIVGLTNGVDLSSVKELVKYQQLLAKFC